MNSRKGNFARQATILAVAAILVRLIGFLYRLPLTNLLGDVGNGIYGAGYNIYTFIIIMSSAGLPAAISKMVSERATKGQYKNAHQVFRVALAEAAILGLIGSFILGFGAETFAIAVDSPESSWAIMTLAPTVFLVAIMAVFRGYFQGLNTTVPTAISQVVEQIFNAVFSVGLAYLLLAKTNDLALGAAGGTAGTGIGALAGLICLLGVYYVCSPVLHKRIRNDENTEIHENKKDVGIEILRTAFPIIIGTAIFSMTNLIDLKMVNSRLLAIGFSREEVDAAYGILTGKYIPLTTLPVSIATAMATAAVPAIAAALAMGDKEAANHRINSALRMGMIFSIPAALGLCFLADPILMLLFPNHPDGGLMLKLGSFSIIFLSIAQISTGMLQGSGYFKVPVFGAFCGAIVKIILNFILISIPSINVYGAVISTTACYIVAASIDLYVLKKIMGKDSNLNLLNGFARPFLSSMAMGVACFVVYHVIYLIIPSNALACIMAILFGMVVYLFFMLLMKGILRKDLLMFPKGEKLVDFLDRYGVV